jgi:MATE family multidrug resistance protein
LSTLVGQALGRQDVAQAIQYTKQTMLILMAYILMLDIIFFSAPHWVMAIFASAESGNALQKQMIDQGRIIIRIMAVFICFDALYFTCIGVLKGAGDTRFIMWSIGLATLFVMIIPIYIGVELLGWGIYACWIILTLYVLTLFCVSVLRYRQGQWKSIRLIKLENPI